MIPLHPTAYLGYNDRAVWAARITRMRLLGRETYFVSETGELCRRYSNHPMVEVHRNSLWVAM